MAVQKQHDQHEHTFSGYVRIRDVVLKTYLGRWTIGRSGERGSGISVLPARRDDDDRQNVVVVLWGVAARTCSRLLAAFLCNCRLASYDHLPPITKTIKVRRTRHAGPCWRSRDELISDVLLWTPTHGRAKVGRPARTYIQQLCEDTGCCPEDLPEAMNDREKWRERERVRDICATSTTWWWWW